MIYMYLASSIDIYSSHRSSTRPRARARAARRVPRETRTRSSSIMGPLTALALGLLVLSGGGFAIGSGGGDGGGGGGGETIVLEAENASVPAGSCWAVQAWAENYYACTFLDGGSTFLSRKGFLGAPAAVPDGTHCVATLNATVHTGGIFAPLVRFEPLDRAPASFETQFQLTIAQGGVVRFSGVYGALGTLTLRTTPTDPVINHALTWAGVSDRVLLEPGPVSVSLSVSAGLSPPNSGRRNVDVVVLTSNLTDLAVRVAHGGDQGNTPLDGLLTQQGDVFLRLRNAADSVPMNLSVPFCAEHSSFWTHLRFPNAAGASSIPPLLLPALPGQSTGWVEAGSRLDTLNDGEWSLQAAPDNATLRTQLHFFVEVGVPATDASAAATTGESPPSPPPAPPSGGAIVTIATFEERGCPLFEATGSIASPKGPNRANVCALILAYGKKTAL
jgi:hypothetical protein